MDYKDTLLMPKTDFEMRGNLTKKEPLILEKWEKMHLYDLMSQQNKDKPYFMLHDGPPYANGNLHMGTAMNRCLKDFVVKSKHMMGYNTPFYPGWDTHGLPIENAMAKLGYDRKKMSVAEFREKCQQYAQSQIEIQKTTEKRLGTVADFDHPYITLHKSFEADQIRTFGKMATKGLIFQGLKPIYWSPERESAVADSEIYYQDKKDMTIYVAFDVKDGKGVLDGDEKFVIWTTTPWTIPANLAICLNPAFTYAVCQTEKGKLIVLDKLVDSLMERFNIADYKVVKTYQGTELEYITCVHPLYPERESLVILGNHVTDEDGTGCVHTAPGHGLDDFYIGQKYGLPAYCPVDDKGCLTKDASERLAGKFVFDANKDVVMWLDEVGHLLASQWIVHSYPHDERMKKPVIFRATVQWFASIEKIRKELLDAIDDVQWVNQFGKVRIHNMIKDRGDWCISRQRVWGVPIPIFYGEDKTPIIDEKVFEHVADLFEEFGSNVWFEREAKDLLPEGYTNIHSPNGTFTKEKDIMDVWFDSGSSHNTFARRGYPYPCDLYLEGSDQYRGWFNSSLIVGVATNSLAPYKAVLSHGYVVDGKGRKMSKSEGNTINPLDVINKYGADILRLWVASVDFQADLKCSDDLFKISSEQYRKIRNTFRFLLGNINSDDFNFASDAINIEDLASIDKYVLVKFNEVISTSLKEYNNYNFIAVNNCLFTFMSNTLSAFYMDYAKDILYIDKKDSLRRRQIQTVFYYLTDGLARLWAPILSYTMEEVYSFFKPEADSVLLESMPSPLAISDSEAIKQKWEQYLLVRSDLLKALEVAKSEGYIKKALECKLYYSPKPEYADCLQGLSNHDLAQLVIASDFEVVSEQYDEYPTGYIKVEKIEGHICPRCWNVVKDVDEDGLCPRCHDILKK
ncbi:MAG: isoleucine--tRNA ligase [Erysipelotrichaceae bacterium]|nr:isoleucine--tRNA ligase [Erysipelotrichaceae bacterium]